MFKIPYLWDFSLRIGLNVKVIDMESIFRKIRQWITGHQDDIVLLVGVILISLLSFAIGFLVAKNQEKKPLKIEYKTMYELVYYQKNYKQNNFSPSCNCLVIDKERIFSERPDLI